MKLTRCQTEGALAIKKDDASLELELELAGCIDLEASLCHISRGGTFARTGRRAASRLRSV
jgi:hypothetical protein